jgi:glycerol-3-phosphate O-acyltransferase
VSNLLKYEEKNLINPKLLMIIQNFYESYITAIQQSGMTLEEGNHLFKQLIDLIMQHSKSPYRFGLFHHSIRKPFDYYQFGLNFIRPLIHFKNSKIIGLKQVEKMIEQTSRGENVILLANHQTEPDPQIISLLLEPYYPSFAAHMIFIAGHRVIEDPMAIPLSLGCNLLCIYSKKHMDHSPEERPKKVSHNQRTMKKMSELLAEGGKCIYVAPSGGRDRPNAAGQVFPAPFDPHSLEMFWLMAQRSRRPTHFYPLALLTYDVLPPPLQVEKTVGEYRQASYTPVFLNFGSEVNMEKFSESETLNKKDRRFKRATYIWNLVYQDYQLLLKEHLQIKTNDSKFEEIL